ncbi:hypothetical protein [Solidesulfovibrio sp.]|uniref:hypothetical protein n=1 Tax=Solidesulfovibrio sp. TaxID=2910990 RepID=UPI00261664EE|nr:hypothetical protein [Solidesulfovibrio sp.]
MHHPLRKLLPLVLLSLLLAADPSPAASEQDSRKTTLYGMFHRTPESGIIFENPQEPDVVYLPFDAKTIMGDSLDIKVQVQGSVVDSFARNGKTYRVLTVDSVRPMAAEYGATTIADGARAGLPGTDAAEVHDYRNRQCYLYPRYAVLDRQAAYSDGHNLRVVARTGADNPDAVCENLEGRPLFEIPNGGDFAYAGLSGDTLFIRNGRADAVHGLMAVDLAREKQTLDATVAPGASVASGVLRYVEVEPATAKPACPAGKTALRDMRLDLRTGKATAAGKVTCQ